MDKSENKTFLIKLTRSSLMGILLAFFITRIIFPIKTVGYSMEPTLHDGQYVLVNKLDKNPRTGDIVVLSYRVSDIEYLVKRVIAIEGDNLEIANGEICINGVKLDEPYIKEQWYDSSSYSGIIPGGYIYIMGDNRNGSIDSRWFGLVEMNKVVGKVLFNQ